MNYVNIQESLAEIRERLDVIEAGCCKRAAEASLGRSAPVSPRLGLLRVDMP